MKIPTIAILDAGLFIGFAEFLTHDWDRVYYVNRWHSSYAFSSVHDVGTGVHGVQVFDSIWSMIEGDREKWREPSEYGSDGFLKDPSVDLFAVMDLSYSDEVDHLRSLGYRVWGAGQAEVLESDRIFAKKHFEKVGIPVGDYTIVDGCDLYNYFKHRRGTYYVKGSSKVRGDLESHRVGSLADLENWLLDVQPVLGMRFDSYQFVVEKAMDDIVEAAFDVYTVDGAFPSCGLLGIEQKGCAYAGHFSKDIPTQFTEPNRVLAPFLKSKSARTFMSTETLIPKDAHPYPTDPCLRAGMPCHGSEQLIYENISEIMFEGAAGKLIEPEPSAEWSAELVLMSGSHKWQTIDVPDDLRDNVRIVNCCYLDGLYTWMPQPAMRDRDGLATIGTVIATGSTFDKATKECCRIANELTGKRTALEVDEGAFGKIEEAFEALAKRGVPLA